ncbi:glycosyltransferase [Marinobacter zhejiangensis]|uniref:Glycosyltransferase, catalytic subunit of cellulose synthase and poly-beta-1,6-N-acetylglucosamine synthase n=1 Tax=Marinobacter zhejiangensis TaxID=488535 RepID=A0A1I4RMX4_9GAMM|nr:glycosyltransferase [Marinobacter zhejiangensis]SFM53587.1 Glycosyltransferase, catalytic subunit of cellulose synthase and poly-beta-1,6-N-acetylglucosamine synthase [Marinobacter zhejiangensis]
MFSVIIPALNEEKGISNTISSIRSSLREFDHEIIVVDNGSSDRTFEIAKELSDKVLIDRDANIGELRNIGARNARGDVLIFNDADVLFTEDWRTEIVRVIDLLDREKVVVGGSLDISDKSSKLSNSWFRPLLDNKWKNTPNYVGTGHMILKRDLFFSSGGFDPLLVSGEDSDFCRKAKGVGAKILFIKELRTIHLGYPSSLKEFFNRECWHGKGDFQSLKIFLDSKVAVFATSMLLFHGLALLLLVMGESGGALISALCAASFPAAYSILRFRAPLGLKGRLENLLVSYVYLVARSLSWLFVKPATQ